MFPRKVRIALVYLLVVVSLFIYLREYPLKKAIAEEVADLHRMYSVGELKVNQRYEELRLEWNSATSRQQFAVNLLMLAIVIAGPSEFKIDKLLPSCVVDWMRKRRKSIITT